MEKNCGDLNLLLGASEAFANDFTLESAAFFEGEPFVVLGETGLALFVDHQYESDPHLQLSDSDTAPHLQNKTRITLFVFLIIKKEFTMSVFQLEVSLVWETWPSHCVFYTFNNTQQWNTVVQKF